MRLSTLPRVRPAASSVTLAIIPILELHGTCDISPKQQDTSTPQPARQPALLEAIEALATLHRIKALPPPAFWETFQTPAVSGWNNSSTTAGTSYGT